MDPSVPTRARTDPAAATWRRALSAGLASGVLLVSWAHAQSQSLVPEPEFGAIDRLFEAVQGSDLAALRELIANGADPKTPRADGSTPLHWASLRGDRAIVLELLAAGVPVDEADENGETPLLLAAAAGHSEIVGLLLDAGASVESVRWSGETPLFAAVHGGEVEGVRRLIDGGAEVNASNGRLGQTPLMWAIAGGHTEISRLLLERGADAAATSTAGLTPFHFAARYGEGELARELVRAGADPFVPTAKGQTALSLALAHARDDVAVFLLELGADIEQRNEDGDTPLHVAVRRADVDLVRELASRGADIDARTRYDSPTAQRRASGALTPFLLAASGGAVEVLQVLLDFGANPELSAPDGTGAVLLSVRSRNLEAVELVVERLGLDVNRRPVGRPDALHTALRLGEDEMVEVLVKHGADLESLDPQGRPPLEAAERDAPAQTLELLRRLVVERAESFLGDE